MNNRHRKIIQLIVLYMENKLSETQQDELTAWLEEDEKKASKVWNPKTHRFRKSIFKIQKEYPTS